MPGQTHETTPSKVVVGWREWVRLDAVGVLQQEDADARVIMLTSDTSPSSRARAEANGAVGYLFKGADADIVLDAVRHVASGGTAWPEDVAAGLLRV